MKKGATDTDVNETLMPNSVERFWYSAKDCPYFFPFIQDFVDVVVKEW